MSWTYELRARPRTLVVARTRADPRMFPALLAEMCAVAREMGCEKAEFWGLPGGLRALAEAAGWKTAEREEHLSAVKWYGPEGEDELEWVNNEKCVIQPSAVSYVGMTTFVFADSAGVRQHELWYRGINDNRRYMYRLRRPLRYNSQECRSSERRGFQSNPKAKQRFIYKITHPRSSTSIDPSHRPLRGSGAARPPLRQLLRDETPTCVRKRLLDDPHPGEHLLLLEPPADDLHREWQPVHRGRIVQPVHRAPDVVHAQERVLRAEVRRVAVARPVDRAHRQDARGVVELRTRSREQ